MFLGTFGVKITVVYVVSGILLGIIGGIVLNRFRLERYLSDWVKSIQQNSETESESWENTGTPFMKRLPVILRDAWGIVRGVLLYVIIGIGIGAAMHGFVPEGFSKLICRKNTGMQYRCRSFWQFPCMPTLQGLFLSFMFL